MSRANATAWRDSSGVRRSILVSTRIHKPHGFNDLRCIVGTRVHTRGQHRIDGQCTKQDAKMQSGWHDCGWLVDGKPTGSFWVTRWVPSWFSTAGSALPPCYQHATRMTPSGLPDGCEPCHRLPVESLSRHSALMRGPCRAGRVNGIATQDSPTAERWRLRSHRPDLFSRVRFHDAGWRRRTGQLGVQHSGQLRGRQGASPRCLTANTRAVGNPSRARDAAIIQRRLLPARGRCVPIKRGCQHVFENKQSHTTKQSFERKTLKKYDARAKTHFSRVQTCMTPVQLLIAAALIATLTACDSKPHNYVGSVNSDVVHVRTCRHAQRIQQKNRVTWPTLAMARHDDRRECEECLR